MGKIWKEVLVVCLRVLRQLLPGGNEEKQQKSRDRCHPGQDLNCLPPEYKLKMLSPKLTCSVV
jgi:hypothetical protein